jgi:hypothetical protein
VRLRFPGLGWIDLLVTAAAGLTFAAVSLSQGHHAPVGPPTDQAIQEMADELGVTAAELRHAAEIVPPPAPGTRPSAAERDEARLALAVVLNVSVDRLDRVMRRHHPHPRD